jgi:thioredoxin
MTTKNAKNFDLTTFREAIANSDQPVLVDFHADWCPPCKVIGPTVDEIAEEYADRVIVGKVDVDANKDIAQEFEVRTIPTLLVFLDGKVVDRLVGITPKEEIARALDSAFASVHA